MLLRYLTTLLPNPTDYRLAVALAPLECADLIAFTDLVASVIPHPEVPEWMGPLRLLVWDDRDSPRLSTGLRAWPAEHVLVYGEDFSTAALTDALLQDAGNRALPSTSGWAR